MKLYFDLLSQPSRALWMFLKLNKIPFEPVVIKIGRGQHLRGNYDQINPFRKVPCIVDEDIKLPESVAIFRYIVAKHPEAIADHWYPKDIVQRAKVDEYLEWQHLGTRSSCAGFFIAKYIEPTITLKKPNPRKIEASKNVMIKTLDLLENVWLKDPSKQFLATNEISFADILAACELEQPKLADFDPFAGRPNLTKWHNLVKEKTNPIYDEAHATAYSFIGTQKKSRFYKLWKMFFAYNY